MLRAFVLLSGDPRKLVDLPSVELCRSDRLYPRHGKIAFAYSILKPRRPIRLANPTLICQELLTDPFWPSLRHCRKEENSESVFSMTYCPQRDRALSRDGFCPGGTVRCCPSGTKAIHIEGPRIKLARMGFPPRSCRQAVPACLEGKACATLL
jgi:hypothetical protein